MRLLALDPATSTGWAKGTSLEDLTFGSFSLSQYPSMGRKMLIFESKLDRLVGFDGPERVDAVMFELSHGSGNQASDRILFGLTGQIEKVCDQIDIKCYETNVTWWRKRFLGAEWVRRQPAGRTDAEKEAWRQRLKEAAVIRCRKLGHETKNDDEAEAVGLFVATLMHWSPPGTRWPAALVGPLFGGG